MSEMKKQLLTIFGIACLTAMTPVTAQETYNKWSIDIDGGAIKPMQRFTPSYGVGLASLFHVGLNGRVMLNPAFGLRFGYGMNDIQGSKNSQEFHTVMHTGALEAMLNVGRIGKFETFSKHLGLMVHVGPGLAFLNGTGAMTTAKEKAGYFTVGFMPIFKLSEKVALTTDLSFYAMLRQNRNWDMQTPSAVQGGFSSSMGTLTVGLSIYLGKSQKHMDWRYEDASNNDELDSLRQALEAAKSTLEEISESMEKVQKDMADDDQDGVANYLDEEPNTPEGTHVDTKGRTVQMPEFKDLMSDPTVGNKLFYTVQLAVFSRNMPENFWKNISPIYTLNIEDGTKRYFTGIFHSVEEATSVYEKAKAAGFGDAFITAYYQGKRITIAEADMVRESNGPEVLREKP